MSNNSRKFQDANIQKAIIRSNETGEEVDMKACVEC